MEMARQQNYLLLETCFSARIQIDGDLIVTGPNVLISPWSMVGLEVEV
jgi:hypothetical protein